MLDAILPFDSTTSNVCHNTGSVGLNQAYTERQEMIRNCQYDDARIWLESKKKWFGRSWQVQKKEGRIRLSVKVFSLVCKWIDKRSYCIFELRRKIRLDYSPSTGTHVSRTHNITSPNWLDSSAVIYSTASVSQRLWVQLLFRTGLFFQAFS